MARPTTEELRKKRISRNDDTIQDRVVEAAPKAIERLIEIIEDKTASHAAVNSASEKILKEFRRYQDRNTEPEQKGDVPYPESQPEAPTKEEESDGFGSIDLGL